MSKDYGEILASFINGNISHAGDQVLKLSKLQILEMVYELLERDEHLETDALVDLIRSILVRKGAK